MEVKGHVCGFGMKDHMRSLVPSGFPCEKIYSLGCRAMAEHRHLLDSPKLDVLGFIQMPQLAKEEVDTSLMHGIDRPWWKIHLFRNTDRIVLTLCRGVYSSVRNFASLYFRSESRHMNQSGQETTQIECVFRHDTWDWHHLPIH